MYMTRGLGYIVGTFSGVAQNALSSSRLGRGLHYPIWSQNVLT